MLVFGRKNVEVDSVINRRHYSLCIHYNFHSGVEPGMPVKCNLPNDCVVYFSCGGIQHFS